MKQLATPTTQVRRADVLALAARADADERSVWKYLAGGEMRKRVRLRIAKAIEESARPNRVAA